MFQSALHFRDVLVYGRHAVDRIRLDKTHDAVFVRKLPVATEFQSIEIASAEEWPGYHDAAVNETVKGRHESFLEQE